MQTELKDIENRLNKKRPLKLQIEIIIPDTLNEFIYQFIKKWNGLSHTIYVDNGEIQTTRSRRRSMGDIYLICKYYYPECTLMDVARILYLNIKSYRGMLGTYCPDIRKRVWRYVDYYSGENVHTSYRDEYNNLVSEYEIKLRSIIQ